MSLDLPSYEEATKNQNVTILKATLVQPSSGRFIHSIPDEIQPGIPSRQFIIIEKCPACGVRLKNFTFYNQKWSFNNHISKIRLGGGLINVHDAHLNIGKR